MTIATKLIAVVLVVLCGYMAAWAVWPEDDPPATVEALALTQASQQGQIAYLQSQMDAVKKAQGDLQKMQAVLKRQVVAVKWSVLNEEQDIHQMMAEVREEVRK